MGRFMTNLIRCRGAVSEIAGLFDAEPAPDLIWTPEIWPGEPALIVAARNGKRRLQTSAWDLPDATFAIPRPQSRRGTLFAREIADTGDGGLIAAKLERCLIVIESFAYPHGDRGERCRAWGGLWDEPLCAWAGLCHADGGFAGLLTPAAEPIRTVSDHMPLLLPREEHDAWLEGQSLLALSTSYPDANYYLERTTEIWSSGRLIDE
ncbi:MAG: hypothetical protein J0H81_10695 [Sphingopyxis terrae]|nr:hypothetical protein [Sphingopyxis terrae]